MKLEALIVALVASTSSAAFADSRAPEVRYDEPSVRDHRMGRWVPLGSMMSASRRNTIRIPEDRDALRAIKLQSGSGAMYVYSIRMVYEDGHREDVAVNKWLYSGDPTMTFKLAPDHTLDRISLRTWTSRPATFHLLGQKSFRRPPVMEPPPPPPAPLPAPVAFMAGRNLTFANTYGSLPLTVGADKGAFSKLRIESLAPTFIGHVHVTFASGAHQTIVVEKTLRAGEIANFDLDGTLQPVASLVVMQNHDGSIDGAGAFNIALLR